MSEDKIVYAICQHRKIVFSCYDFNDRKLDNMKLETNEQGKLIQHKVSPYYLDNDADEYYLIVQDPTQDTSEKPHLSHFKISLIADKIQILSEETLSITEMQEYPRYFLGSTYSVEESMAHAKCK